MDKEVIKLLGKKAQMELIFNPKISFINCLYGLSKEVQFEDGVSMLAGISGVFSYSGISFKMGRKVLGFCKNRINTNDVALVICYELSAIVLGVSGGVTDFAKEYDDDLVNRNLRIGEVFFATAYTAWHGMLLLDMGHFHETKKLIDKLSEINNLYGNYFAGQWKYLLNIRYLLKIRKLYDALREVDEGIIFSNRIDLDDNTVWLFQFYYLKSRILSFLMDTNGAEELLNRMKKDLPKYGVPFHLCPYYLTEFIFYINKLNRLSNDDDQSELTETKKKALRTGKKMMDISSKAFFERTEVLKYMGIYFWIIGKQKRALKLFGKSIALGKQIHAKVELSRIYFEVGFHLLKPKANISH